LSKSIYLVNPSADFPSYFTAEGVEAWGLPPAICLADLTLPTVAALAPDHFELELCDESVAPVDFATPADFVALTGNVSQWGRMRAIAAEFRRRGKTVILGGPFVSLCPEVARDHCDILVRGEIEEIAAGLFADLDGSCWRDEYVGTRPPLDLVPPPRWDLYPNERTLIASLQTSRGCPFACEFCDVIQYLGQRQRHKPVANVLRELDDLYRLGYRSVFLADDNFTVVRRRAKELLAALKEWNDRQSEGKVLFSTQLSIDAARDDELLRMCAEAGLLHAFIGVETPNEESLRESRKPQNLGVDLIAQVDKFHQHGIMVIAGMIVGFDSDGSDIFRRQLDFADTAAIPILTLGALVAPAATPLHERMKSAGRLSADGSEVAAAPWATNIVPKQMSQLELMEGIQWLAKRLYVDRFGQRTDPRHLDGSDYGFRADRQVEKDALQIIKRIADLGRRESRMMYSIFGALSSKPRALEPVAFALLQYAQIRHMYERGRLWESPPMARTA
jgi:radical SAM superfamily enzyme YgiQ (UPF0313 family)